MILINKKQVTVKELEKVLGVTIPVEKIIKKPLFEINPVHLVPDPDNGRGAVKVRQGMEFPAYFRTRLKNGEEVEVRYCINRVPDIKTHGQTEIFSPKKVTFSGKSEFVKEDEDMAIYYYLHFYNKQSPFRAAGFPYEGKPFEFEFQDDQAKADAEIAKMETKYLAITHAGKLSGDELLIIAKGIKIDGVESMDERMVKARLMQFAEMNPQIYMDKANSQVNQMEGLIRDAMDKQILVLSTNSSSSVWKWGKGARDGQLIIEISRNNPDARGAFITYIKETAGAVNDFLPVLMDARLSYKTENNMKNQLEGISIMDMVKAQSEINTKEVKTDEDDLPLDFPKEFKECGPYLNERIGTAAPTLAGKLWKAIKAGEVNAENVEDYIKTIKE